MKEFNWKTLRSRLSDFFQLRSFHKSKPKVKGYRIISTENLRYLAFDGKPAPDRIRFVTDIEQAYVFRDEIAAFPYILSLHCLFAFEPVIQKANRR